MELQVSRNNKKEAPVSSGMGRTKRSSRKTSKVKSRQECADRALCSSISHPTEQGRDLCIVGRWLRNGKYMTQARKGTLPIIGEEEIMETVTPLVRQVRVPQTERTLQQRRRSERIRRISERLEAEATIITLEEDIPPGPREPADDSVGEEQIMENVTPLVLQEGTPHMERTPQQRRRLVRNRRISEQSEADVTLNTHATPAEDIPAGERELAEDFVGEGSESEGENGEENLGDRVTCRVPFELTTCSCGQAFLNANGYRDHVSTRHKGRTLIFRCSKCGTFARNSYHPVIVHHSK